MEVAARAAHSLSTLALLVAGSACAATTDYPNRPLRLVTPVLPRTAGGPVQTFVHAEDVARALVDAVRRRKGLPVEEKVVAVATKQRTQARKR